MIPCPACKPADSDPEPENSYGWDWNNHNPRPFKFKQTRLRQCRICQGSGVLHSFELDIRRDFKE